MQCLNPHAFSTALGSSVHRAGSARIVARQTLPLTMTRSSKTCIATVKSVHYLVSVYTPSFLLGDLHHCPPPTGAHDASQPTSYHLNSSAPPGSSYTFNIVSESPLQWHRGSSNQEVFKGCSFFPILFLGEYTGRYYYNTPMGLVRRCQ